MARSGRPGAAASPGIEPCERTDAFTRGHARCPPSRHRTYLAGPRRTVAADADSRRGARRRSTRIRLRRSRYLTQPAVRSSHRADDPVAEIVPDSPPSFVARAIVGVRVAQIRQWPPPPPSPPHPPSPPWPPLQSPALASLPPSLAENIHASPPSELCAACIGRVPRSSPPA